MDALGLQTLASELEADVVVVVAAIDVHAYDLTIDPERLRLVARPLRGPAD